MELTRMNLCPCGSADPYSQCCEPFLNGDIAPTPEALMRSRYTAYSLARIDYIQNTMREEALLDFNAATAAKWARQVKWIGLKVIRTQSIAPDHGRVEFIASLIDGSHLRPIHEISEFRKDQGIWFYVRGHHPTDTPSLSKKIERNEPCPCGSHNKFKLCHG